MIAFEEEEQTINGLLGKGSPAGYNAALHKGSQSGDINSVKKALSSGASIDSVDEETGCAALHIAAAHGKSEVLELLIESKASIDSKNSSKATALHCAALNGQAKITRLLISKGADANARDINCCTPLLLAAYYGHTSVAKVLLESEVDIRAIDTSGKNAIRVARERKNTTMLSVLQGRTSEQPSSCEASDLFGITCLTCLEETEAFSKELAHNTGIEKVTLSGSNLGVPGATHLSRALLANETVTTLILGSAIKSAEEMRVLASGLSKNRNIQELDLSGSDRIGVAGFRDVADMLTLCRQLKILWMSHSIQNAGEAAALARGLGSRCRLKELDISHSRLAPKRVGHSGMKALAEAIKANFNLKKLNMASTLATVNESQELAAALLQNTSLQELDISDSKVGSSGVRCIIDTVKVGSNLTSLKIEEQYLRQLQKARRTHSAFQKLTKGDSLIDLNLASCLSSEDEAEKIMDGMKKDKTLESLDLTNNTLGITAVRLFADILSNHPRLTSLNLSSALSNEEECTIMFKALRNNQSLKTLSLHQCPLDEKNLEYLKAALINNSTLVRIRGLSLEHEKELSPYLALNQLAAGDSKNAEKYLEHSIHLALNLEKQNVIPGILANYDVAKVSLRSPDGTSVHERVLRQDCTDVNALSALLKASWVMDENMSELIMKDATRQASFEQAVVAIAKEGWVSPEHRWNMLHFILDSCRSRILEQDMTVALCKKILAVAPALSNEQNKAGETPPEIAACCIQAPEVQSLFLLGILAALQRRRWELQTVKQELEQTKAQAEKDRREGAERDLEQRLLIEELTHRNKARDETIAKLGYNFTNHKPTQKDPLTPPSKTTLPLEYESGSQYDSNPRMISPDFVDGDDEATAEVVEIECEELEYNGEIYLLDPLTSKVYSLEGGNQFVGKMHNSYLDFQACDSDDDADA
eukprot:m.47825 g.47825  ORF g.47825 m.47825 type:complete len:934 (+) comp10535_c0_seq1:335-3136(+)